MKKLLFTMIVPLLFAACGGNSAAPAEQNDSVRTDSLADTAEVEETPPPEAVDKVFADFLYDFMRQPKFQAARVHFPLKVLTDTVASQMPREQWAYQPMFAKQELYLNLFSGDKAEVIVPDTGAASVRVKMLQRKQRRVKTYKFERITGTWMLTAMADQPVSADVKQDFAAFFLRFASDFVFQQQHIADPFDMSVLQEDGTRMDGIAMAMQWPDFAVEFPKGTIPVVDYTDEAAEAKGGMKRTIQLTDGTMACDLTFTQQKKGWMLTALKDE